MPKDRLVDGLVAPGEDTVTGHDTRQDAGDIRAPLENED